MFVQTEVTPNPNSLKFLPGKKVSNSGPYEIINKDDTQNSLVRNILSINGIEGIFLGEDFISVNKKDITKWDDVKHIVISFINDFYSEGKEFVIDESLDEQNVNLDEIEQRIVKILDQKIRPAVARDGGDIKFKEFKDGVVKVQLQGSCSGCPSSTMTLKQGVQNLLCHYLPEVKEVGSFVSLQREYGETLFNNAREAMEAQTALMQNAFAEARDAVQSAFAPEVTETAKPKVKAKKAA